MANLTPPCSINLQNEAQTMELGAHIATLLPSGGIVLFYGDLGAGKTTMVRGLIRSLGFTGTVKSPTYTLVEPYSINDRDIYHFDLYRLADPEELEFLGIRDYFRTGALCLIEWPEKAGSSLPEVDLIVSLEYKNHTRLAILKKPIND
ncbi:MAG: tRNA (adenosine(37)-N6)-threonylcarbamoyltransferase complex ATPase subunit type 1 TsaE [Leucothrix sp.]